MNRVRKVFLALALVSAAPAFAENDGIPEIRGYQDWKAVTSAPIQVPEYLYTLCRGLTPEEKSIASSPHRSRHIRVRVNPRGEQTFYSSKFEPFPVGSVVVKEKFSDGNFKTVESLGAMVKGESGWEFIYQDNGGRVLRGPTDLKNCYSCHSSLNERDQVFRTYLGK